MMTAELRRRLAAGRLERKPKMSPGLWFAGNCRTGAPSHPVRFKYKLYPRNSSSPWLL
jgi:hypothetical protein